MWNLIDIFRNIL